MIQKAGGQAVVSPLSVSDPAAAAALISVCVERFGGIDSLVNNAAQSYSVDAWADDPARQAELITTNVLGTMWTGNAAIAEMKKTGVGHIINTASGSAIGSARGAAYSASKGAAVLAITYSWAGSGWRPTAYVSTPFHRLPAQAWVLPTLRLPKTSHRWWFGSYLICRAG